VDRSILYTVELCSGVGMLGEGLAAGLGYLGFDSLTLLHAEREAYPAAVLAARMEEGSLAPAPIWFGGFTELDAARFRGVVDCIVGGFPCQDLSLAGRRAGLDGKRSGLFFEICRIADDCCARFLFLENVAGIASATATVVDEAEGELDERAAARVLGELADRGWHAEWVTLSAASVGASHGRERWFCWAWRELADAESNGHGARGKARNVCETHGGQGEPLQPIIGSTSSTAMAHTSGPRPQGGELSGARFGSWAGEETHGSTEQLCRPLFAPGPADQAWAGIIQQHPHLAPALEPDFCQLVDGVAHDMGDCLPQRLKCCGNGVVAAQAAFAACILIARAKGFSK
jgi:site-specific DNA-cytosine methylase